MATRKNKLSASTAIVSDVVEIVDNAPVSNEPVALPPYAIDEIDAMAREDIADINRKEGELEFTRQHLAMLAMARFELRVANGDKLTWPTAWKASKPGAHWESGVWLAFLSDAKQAFLGDAVRAGRKDAKPEQVSAAAVYRKNEEHVKRACALAVDIRSLGGTWQDFNFAINAFELPRDCFLNDDDMWLDFKMDKGVITVTLPERLPMDGKSYSIKTGTGTFTGIFTSMQRVLDVADNRRNPKPVQERDTKLPVASAAEAKQTIAAIDAVDAQHNGVNPNATNVDPLKASADQSAIERKDARDAVAACFLQLAKIVNGKPGASGLTLDDFTRDQQNDVEDGRRYINQLHKRTQEAREEAAKAENKKAA